jgi:hypothetical protein
MGTRFENRTRRLVILELNSGATVHLSPGETSQPIEAYELENNLRLEKLLRSNALSPALENGAASEP